MATKTMVLINNTEITIEVAMIGANWVWAKFLSNPLEKSNISFSKEEEAYVDALKHYGGIRYL